MENVSTVSQTISFSELIEVLQAAKAQCLAQDDIRSMCVLGVIIRKLDAHHELAEYFR